jgi:hypothetical protein
LVWFICLLVLLAPRAVSAAFIEPSDVTGSFGADPSGWGNTPNTVATVRSLPTWSRPSSNAEAAAAFATYQAWDVFTAVGAGNANLPNPPGAIPDPPRVDLSPANPNGTAAVFETTGAALVTGGGNIYSPFARVAMRAEVPNYALGAEYLTHVLLQIRTQGTDLDLASLAVNGVPASTLADYSHQAVYTASLGAAGSLVDHKFEFTLAGNGALDAITWTTLESSSSQDKVSIDTLAVRVPEPSSVLMLMVGAGLLCRWRRLTSRACPGNGPRGSRD